MEEIKQKTKENILFSHSPVFDPLFADPQVKKWRENVCAAMEEYSNQQLSEFKEKLKKEIEKSKGDKIKGDSIGYLEGLLKALTITDSL